MMTSFPEGGGTSQGRSQENHIASSAGAWTHTESYTRGHGEENPQGGVGVLLPRGGALSPGGTLFPGGALPQVDTKPSN